MVVQGFGSAGLTDPGPSNSVYVAVVLVKSASSLRLYQTLPSSVKIIRLKKASSRLLKSIKPTTLILAPQDRDWESLVQTQ